MNTQYYSTIRMEYTLFVIYFQLFKIKIIKTLNKTELLC
jgi:hypothetical protein